MKNKYRFLVIAIPLVVTLGYIYRDRLPPRTACKVAARISGLRIPSDSEVLYYKEQWTGYNNGYCRIALKLQSAAYKAIRNQLKPQSFKPLNFELLATYQPLPVTVNPKQSIYRFGPKGEYGDFSTVILDDEHQLLITCLDYY